jgi:hypothetical protein
MNKLLLLAGLLSLTSCAGAQLQSDWKEKRGYSDADVQLIMDQYKEYNMMMSSAQVSSNAFNSTPIVEAKGRLKNVFCACVKKIGEKCRKKPESLTSDEKVLWVKANAVDMAYIGKSASFEVSQNPVIDTAECM